MSIKGVIYGILANLFVSILIIAFNKPVIILIPGMFVGIVVFEIGYMLGGDE